MKTPQPASDREWPARLAAHGSTRFRLRRRLTGAALLTALIPVAVVAVAAYLYERSSLTDSALERIDAVASAQHARLDGYIDASIETVTLLASRTQLRLSLRDHLAIGDDQALLTARRIIVDARDASPSIHAIHIVDAAASIIVSTDADVVGRDLSDDRHVTEGLEGITVGPVVAGEDGQVHILAGPLVLDEAVLGAVVVEVSPAPLLALVDDYAGLGATGETLLAAPAPGGGFVFLTPLRFQRDAALRTGPPASAIPTWEQALAGDGRVITDHIDYRGERAFVVTRHVDRAGWALMVKIDVDEALAPARAFASFAILTTIAAALLAAVLAWWGARSVAEPVRHLTETALSIRLGDRTRRVMVDRSDELGALAEAFNDMTDELTAATDALEASRLRLEELLRSKDRLIASVSHELRTPLTAVVGWAEVLADPTHEIDDAERAEILALMASQGRDLGDLIQDLLVAASTEPDAIPVASMLVDLSEQARVVVDTWGFDPDRDVEVHAPDSIRILGDPIRVRQILRNLVVNSLRYGGDSLQVEVTTMDGSGVIRVVDNGEGIPEEDRVRVFDAYQSAHPATGTTGAVGLGLTVSRTLARRMGGDLVYRYDGESIFELTLPLHDLAVAGRRPSA